MRLSPAFSPSSADAADRSSASGAWAVRSRAARRVGWAVAAAIVLWPAQSGAETGGTGAEAGAIRL
ncbi:MAG: hypothetical protein AAF909_03310, partial [Pseudomonadota bacterium]